MIDRNRLLHFLVIIVFMSFLNSCISREEYTPEQNGHSGYIEFVVRPTSYNGQVVNTKAISVDDFENSIHNCYFMVFDNVGQRVIGPIDMNATFTTQRISRHEILSKLGSGTRCTACFVANVPKDVVDGLTTLNSVNSTVLEITYSNLDIQDTDDNSKVSSFVIPEFDLDGSGANEAVQCLPMFGLAPCDLSTADLFQVPVKRLFAKVTVNISVSATRAKFDILAAHLFNLPAKVRLAESDNENDWVDDAAAFLPHQIEGPINGDNIVGGLGGGVGAGEYDFYFYVPEYYLLPLASTTDNYGNEKYKPQMFDSSKRPVFVRLFGTYNDESKITYDLYLGENNATSFTLKRNVHYMNSMNIQGITNSKTGSGATLDCRVDVTTEEFDEVEVLGQTANCYIIGRPGTYRYPACKGVFKGGVNNIPDEMKCKKDATLKLLYSDNSSIKIENLNYDKDACEFSFEVISLDGGGGLLASNDGNVILGLVYTEGGQEKIEWSWHIWIQSGTTLDLNLGFFDFGASNQTYPNGAIMMDRNLGARPTTLEYPGVEPGAYYRYGRKEPFLGGNYQGLVESAYYDWSGPEKAITDPCPAGYRVPTSSVWSGNTTKKHFEADVAGVGIVAFQFWDAGTPGLLQIQDDIFYPYSGYIDDKLVLKQSYSSPYLHTGTYTEEVTALLRRYRNVEYSITLNYTSGILQGSDQSLIYEGVRQGALSNITLIKAERKALVGNTWSEYVFPSTGNNIIDAILDILNETLKRQIEEDIQDLLQKNQLASINASHGYQVRCVRE